MRRPWCRYRALLVAIAVLSMADPVLAQRAGARVAAPPPRPWRSADGEDPGRGGVAGLHRRLWQRLRALAGLSEAEVQTLIFQRHDFPPETIEITFSPAPTPLTPTPSEAPTEEPTRLATPYPTRGAPSNRPPVPPTSSRAPTGPTPKPTAPTTEVPTVAPSRGASSEAPSTDTDQPSAGARPSRSPGPTAVPLPTVTAAPSNGAGGPTAGPTVTGRPTLSPAPTATAAPSGAGTGGPSATAGPTAAAVPTASPAPSSFGSQGPTALPVPTVSAAPSPTNGTATAAPSGVGSVEEFLASTLTDNGALAEPGTPQNAALEALLTSFPDLDPANGPEEQRLIQETYALNTLYFALGGANWAASTDWTGPPPVCTPWLGVTCTAQAVTELDLSENDLMGTLPSEIRGLSSLGTSNGVGMVPDKA